MYTFSGGNLHNKRTYLVPPISIPIIFMGVSNYGNLNCFFQGLQELHAPISKSPGRTAPRLPAHEAELLIAHPSCGLGQLELADLLRNSDERCVFI